MQELTKCPEHQARALYSEAGYVRLVVTRLHIEGTLHENRVQLQSKSVHTICTAVASVNIVALQSDAHYSYSS